MEPPAVQDRQIQERKTELFGFIASVVSNEFGAS